MRAISKGVAALLLLLTLPALLPVDGYAQNEPKPAERMAFVAFKNGQWDLYSINPDGSLPHRLTNTTFEETDPSYSPDGSKLAFASRRNNNWDIYVLDLRTGQETRLTTNPHYDGAPTWRPDGEAIAFESYRNGSLDIWQVGLADDSAPESLTPNTPESGEFSPAYSPNGAAIAFAGWRAGSTDLYLLDTDSGEVTQLTDSRTAETRPAWHPNGQTLAYVHDDKGDREIYSLDVENPPLDGGAVKHITWLGRTDGPAWSPTGDALAGVFHRWDGEQITRTTLGPGRRLSTELTDIIAVQGRLTWHPQAINFGSPIATLSSIGPSALYTEQFETNNEAGLEPYNLVRQNDITTGTPWLADTVDDSFQAWRRRLRSEVGYDFLNELSDAARDVASYTENSQYASWHKSGRAIDTLFDYHLNGELAHEIVKEDYGGETYWRVYLRCVDQSGACGRPLTGKPWNYSARARTIIAPEQGGIEKAIPQGYYVDKTAIAREYGWDRISSYDDGEFGWTWNFIAFEYWHYQKRYEVGGTANWYRAMRDVYPEDTLQRYFNWQKMRRLGDDPHLIALKGVPLPLEQRPWWALVQP